MAEALLLAALLHVPPGPVDAFYRTGGLQVVALVSCENVTWNPGAIRREPRGHTSYGWGQLDDEWHEQYRDDPLLHLVETVRFFRVCQSMARGVTPRTMPDRVYMGDVLARTVAYYNGGSDPGERSLAWGRAVERKRDSMAMYLWRRLR